MIAQQQQQQQQQQQTAQSELLRLSRQAGVEGVLCVDRRDRSIVQSTLDAPRSESLAGTILSMLELLDEQTATADDPTLFVRVRTRQRELLAAPHGHFVLVTVTSIAQNK